MANADQNIRSFMEAYRATKKRITPKLHMLEDHTVAWIQKWGVGVGFHSEQGAESIHMQPLQSIKSNIQKYQKLSTKTAESNEGALPEELP